jgi:Na+-transporting NADH:ubiquinone oxidoreductase subunit F
MVEIVLGVALFTAIVLVLAMVVLAARAWLVVAGTVTITVNDKRTLEAPSGITLLEALPGEGIHLPSACGGVGTCGLCGVRVTAGGREPLPMEKTRFRRDALAKGTRLACQLKLREDMSVEIPEDILGVRTWTCRVRSNDSVASLIKELVLDLPQGETMDFRAGCFVQVTSPPYRAKFSDFDVADRFRPLWDRLGLWRLEAASDEPVTRAYSMANYPDEEGIIILNVRVALPPPGAGDNVPPGVVSSYLFSLRPGEPVTVSGPYGYFFASDTEREMVYVGGGVGMAPLRAHIFDLLKRRRTRRRISFWYGARSRQELFYTEDFDRLQAEHENFEWHVALSEPQPEDRWQGYTGFIHEVLYENYLKEHPMPEECEYYLCGPPMMITAVTNMLDKLGVERENVSFDDFGG